ncbi:tetratricopeptide repeat protein [Streptosporangium canum]|uniref:tetratricopeptide repeat protein n=1 Tax=Streptosporangium canum TaxID=324952 RepID=UPI0033BD277A
MGRGRIAAVLGGLALVAAAPAALTAFKVTDPWALGAAALVAALALALVAAGFWQERFKRLGQRRDEQRFKVADGLLTFRSGRVPKVRQVRDPLPLGVHPSAPAQAAGVEPGRVAGNRVPVYVPRDVDGELREQLAAGGVVLLVGDSTAGKTRAAFEAMRAQLPDHQVFVPADKNAGKDVMAAIIERIGQARKAVLWLDDLEHFLRSGTLTSVQLARILGGRGHKVILATLRSAEEDQLTHLPPDSDAIQRGLGDQAAHVLEQAHRIRLKRIFSPAELKRTHVRAADERIADALDYAGEYGIAEYLAAGPHLQDAHDNAWAVGRNPRGAALMAAAIDCRRAGHLSPLPRALLEELHQGYLDEHGGQRLRPEPLEQAWQWATRQRRSTAAPLQSVDEEGARVEVFDYLVDRHQQRVGPTAYVPDQVIPIILRHAVTTDTEAVALQMRAQGRYGLAAAAFQQAVQARRDSDGEEHPSTLSSRGNLAGVLRGLGRLEEAEVEHWAVLGICRRVLGEEHPSTLTSRNNLAATLRDLGRLEEAQALE